MEKILLTAFITASLFCCSIVSAANPKLYWNKPATVSGTIGEGTIADCCVNGQPMATKFYFVQLDQHLDVFGQNLMAGENSTKELINVTQVQVDFSGSEASKMPKAGDQVTANCKSISRVKVGHYALPTLCDGATIVSILPQKLSGRLPPQLSQLERERDATPDQVSNALRENKRLFSDYEDMKRTAMLMVKDCERGYTTEYCESQVDPQFLARCLNLAAADKNHVLDLEGFPCVTYYYGYRSKYRNSP